MEIPLGCPGLSRALAFGDTTPNSLGGNLVRKRRRRQMGAAPYSLWLQLFHSGRRDALYQRFRSTSVGLRPSAVNVPARPSASVTATAASAAPAASPATKTKGNSITRVTIRPA